MNRLAAALAATSLGALLLVAACAPAAPAAPTAAPTKAAAPAATTAPAAAAAPTKAAAPAPTAAPAATAAPAWPEKGRAITFIIQYAAGGGSDVAGRVLAALMEKDLGVPVQVVNKGGAGGQVGFTEMTLAKPDGYTFGWVVQPTVITTYLDPSRKAVFNRKTFELIGMHDRDAGVVAVKGDSPYKTFKDLIDAARAKPGSIRACTAGILSDDHIAILKTEQSAGIDLAVVHFDGSVAGMTALMGGHIEAFYGNQSELTSQVKSGDMRILALFDKERSSWYPDVPTAAEQGVPIEGGVHHGLALPAGVPKNVVDRLVKAHSTAANSADFKNKMQELRYTPIYMNPADYNSFWDSYEKDMQPLVEMVNREEQKK